MKLRKKLWELEAGIGTGSFHFAFCTRDRPGPNKGIAEGLKI